MEKKSIIFILQSIHHVLRAEKFLEKAGVESDLIPVPKEINPECGMAIEMAPSKESQVEDVLDKAKIIIKARYLKQGKKFINQA